MGGMILGVLLSGMAGNSMDYFACLIAEQYVLLANDEMQIFSCSRMRFFAVNLMPEVDQCRLVVSPGQCWQI